MRSKSSLDKLISKLATKYPKGIYKYCEPIIGRLLSQKEVLAILGTFDGMSDHIARQKFAELIWANNECRAVFMKHNENLIKNWFNGLVASKKDRERRAKQALREKRQMEANKRRYEQEQKRLAAEEKRLDREAKRAERIAMEKKKLWKQLNLTAEQKDILRKIAE